jgi:tRNA dimethylallyltransferase
VTAPEHPRVLAVFGPTAVGKTAVALALARRLRDGGARPVAVSADALQVYRGLETLTGVASAAERAALEHRLVSCLPVSESFSAGAFARLAHAEIDELLAQGATPIVVGGTGLYLRAALADLDLRPPPPPALRERWEAELAAVGPHGLHERLAARAPWAARDIPPTDASRLVRAHELLDLDALTPAEEPSRLWTSETRHPTHLAALTMERGALYARIDARVDAMLAAGAAEEARDADAAGASPTARKAVGFEELLRGDVEAMRRRTRQLAKRQLTWLRKLPAAVQRVDVTGRDPGDVAAEILGAARWGATGPP